MKSIIFQAVIFLTQSVNVAACASWVFEVRTPTAVGVTTFAVLMWVFALVVFVIVSKRDRQ